MLLKKCGIKMKYKKIKKCLNKHKDNKYGKYLNKYKKEQERINYEIRKERLMPYIKSRRKRQTNL